jgi:hypothetical protein
VRLERDRKQVYTGWLWHTPTHPRRPVGITHFLYVVARRFWPVPDSQATKIKIRRAALEAFLLRHLHTVPEDVGCHGSSFRMLRAAGLQPTATAVDLLRAACRRELLKQFNPFLSAASVEQLWQGVLVWLQLCVMEDRLTRVLLLAAAGEEYRIPLIRVSGG